VRQFLIPLVLGAGCVSAACAGSGDRCGFSCFSVSSGREPFSFFFLAGLVGGFRGFSVFFFLGFFMRKPFFARFTASHPPEIGIPPSIEEFPVYVLLEGSYVSFLASFSLKCPPLLSSNRRFLGDGGKFLASLSRTCPLSFEVFSLVFEARQTLFPPFQIRDRVLFPPLLLSDRVHLVGITSFPHP